MSLLSLQAHIVNLPSSPVAVSVDPKGFKAAIQSFMRFLIVHQVRATLWLKLPKDDAWWQDIWQYGRQAAGCTIYSLGEQTGDPPDTLAASLRPIPIEQTAELKREYLCLAVCDQFVGSLVAARVASGAAISGKRTLQLYSSTSLSVGAALSTGIKAIITSNLPGKALDSQDLDLSDEKAITGAAALSQWNRLFPKSLWTQAFLPLSEAFLAWQIQCQEKLRSQLNEHQATSRATAGESTPESINANFIRQAREELQSPLTTIKTALTLLESPTIKLVQRQRYLEMIATQCDRQKNLINSITELLQLQTTQSQQPQPIELSGLVPGIVSIYQPIAKERGIILAYTIPEQLQTVLGTEAELKQVVILLVKNSIQRTAQGGRVWVSAIPEGERFVALTVQDSGSFITKSEINRLFEAFHPSADGGTANLRLILVQQLMQRMEGRVVVESTPDQGTAFKVLLPVQLPVRATAPSLTSAATSQSAHSKGHLLDTDHVRSQSSVEKRDEERNIEKERVVNYPPESRQTPIYV